MNYYKVLKESEDGSRSVVDAQGGPLCVRYQERQGLMLFCSIEQAQGITDSFGQGLYWHIDGWEEFPETAGVTETVILELIDEGTYAILHEALAAGQTIPDPEPEPEPEEPDDDTLEVVRSGKLSAMSAACSAAIISGVDVVLSDGAAHHFSLTVEDQLNLVSLQALITAGQTEIPYHADGEACKYFSAEDFTAVVTAATAWKTYHESYYNSLRTYIEALDTIEAVASITYGITIPEEYQSDVLVQLTAALLAQGAEVVS